MIDKNEIKRELLFFLRNKDIISIEERGVETKSDKFTLDNTDELAIEGKVKNIREIKQGTDVLEYLTDYTYNVKKGAQIEFKKKITGDLDITYDTGGPDKIFSEFPRVDLSIASYPRVAFEIVSVRTNELDLGANSNLSDILISISVFATKNEDLDEITKNIRTAILNNKKSFKFSKFVTITGQGRTDGSDESQIVSSNIDMEAKFIVE